MILKQNLKQRSTDVIPFIQRILTFQKKYDLGMHKNLIKPLQIRSSITLRCIVTFISYVYSSFIYISVVFKIPQSQKRYSCKYWKFPMLPPISVEVLTPNLLFYKLPCSELLRNIADILYVHMRLFLLINLNNMVGMRYIVYLYLKQTYLNPIQQLF